MTLTVLLKLLDRYPSLVPTKGSHTWFYPTHIYVTTNIVPRDWYKWEKRLPQYKALQRRFSRTLIFSEDENPIEATEEWWDLNSPSHVPDLFPFGPPL